MRYSSAAVLQMPSSYVPMSTEEMEYLEGGRTTKSYYRTIYLSQAECARISDIMGYGADTGTVGAGVLGYLTCLGKPYGGYAVLTTIATALLSGNSRFWNMASRYGLRCDIYKLTYSTSRGSRGDTSYTCSTSIGY